MIYGNKIGGSRDTKTYIISFVDENQNEIINTTGVVVDKEEVFNACCEHVMAGYKFASDEGIMTGTNDSPCCRITNGIHEVMPGVEFLLKLEERDQWDYTTFAAMMWPKLDAENPTPRVNMVAIDNAVYDTSGNKIADVVKDIATKTIRFNMVENGERMINKTATPYLLYFSVCKEELI